MGSDRHASPPGAVAIRQAQPGEERAISSILEEAAAWLESRGQSMWLPGELSVEQITEDVRDGLYFVAEQSGDVVGTIRFQLTDDLFWPDVAHDDAAYIHRFAVRRTAAGGGLSAALLNWAVERTRSRARRYLRLDCEAARPKLRLVYERFGFKHHSDRQVGPHFVARYQMDVTTTG